jgi:2-haloacid dehalogenase
MLAPMKYKWILFDADDTLFDFPASEAKALRLTMNEVGIEFSPEILALYSGFNRQVWKELERGELDGAELRVKRFRLLFRELGSSLDPVLVSPVYLRNLARGSELLPGAEELVAWLAGRCGLALVTNGLKDVQRPRIEASALRGRFERIFISEELGAAKPSRAFFEAVFEGLGRPAKAETLVVGDSLSSDMAGGIDYGIDTCWYNPAGAETDLPVTFRIGSLGELRLLLDS